MSTECVDLVALQLLVAVAETGSLGQAAARRGVSQPAVSMRMTALEHQLGLRLLQRDPTGTRLTPAGEQIVASGRAVLGAADSLEALAERLRAEQESHLRVAASLTIAEHLLPAWLGVLTSELPDVSLGLEVVNSSRVLKAVAHGSVDLGFIEGICRPLAGMATETLHVDELVVVVRPEHAWARAGRPIGAAELAATELVVRERGSGTREVLDAALEAAGGTRSRLELGSSAALLTAARRGEGPAVLSSLAAAADVARGDLVTVPLDGVDLSRHLRGVWRKANGLGPLAARLLAVALASATPALAPASS